MMRQLSIVALLAACGCTSSSPPITSTTATALSKDEAVLEAVFLHELKASPPAAGEGVCLAVRGLTTDGKALREAIRAKYPTAVDNSECSGGGTAGPVKISATGAPGVRFDIGPVQWTDDSHAKCNGGGAHREGGAREIEYTLEKDRSGWKVTAEKVLMMM